MNVYVYQAALYCEECGEAICRDLQVGGKAPEDIQDESSYDSDDFPKGPYPDGGGEADCPNHCDECNVFLENPLTSEGYDYVKEIMANAALEPSDVLQEWINFYDIQVDTEYELDENDNPIVANRR